MGEGPKDFMPGFEGYDEFRSALKNAEEVEAISQKDDATRLRDFGEEESDNDNEDQDEN